MGQRSLYTRVVARALIGAAIVVLWVAIFAFVRLAGILTAP